ncbi:MAG: hypothetical protein JWQ50_2623 [Caballeronia mineralivorans]|jgi:hypothetical protein|nr:hypothetical protein [Caballeronia mineralivorans]MEA3098354.1 hypothetical protein [Caballeronia mineralivorans]
MVLPLRTTARLGRRGEVWQGFDNVPFSIRSVGRDLER